MCSNMDGTKTHTEWNQKEKDTIRYHLYVGSKIWQQMIYLQNGEDHGHAGPTCVCGGWEEGVGRIGVWGW